MADIMFAGIGGQGVLTAAKILIEIAAEHGKNVSWTSEYLRRCAEALPSAVWWYPMRR